MVIILSIGIFCFLENNFSDIDDEEMNEEDVDDSAEQSLQEKKAKLKSQFDAEYDQSKDPNSAYLDDLKKEVDLQSKLKIANFYFQLS